MHLRPRSPRAPARRALAAAAAAAMLLASPGAPAQGGGPPPVSVATPLQGPVTDYDEFTGRFEAAEQVAVQARVSGYLKSVHFTDGQRVAAGDLLYIIDPRPFEAAVARAQAILDRAESQVTLADLELARAERLLATNAMAREEVDSRRAARRVSAADADAARANLRAAALDLEFTRVTAPVAGRVSATRVDVGNLVVGGAGSATTLTTIVSRSPIFLVFDVSESEYLRYSRLSAAGPEPDMHGVTRPVHARLLDESGWPREGTLNFVDNRFDPGSGTIRMRATFDNPDGLLVPGLFARLRIAASPEYQALLVPDRAIFSDQAAKLVMVVDGEGVVRPRPVVLGPLSGALRVIREGLSGSERIIVDGLLRARPGSKVTPEIVEIRR